MTAKFQTMVTVPVSENADAARRNFANSHLIVRMANGEELVNLSLHAVADWTFGQLLEHIHAKILGINRERRARGEPLHFTTVAFPSDILEHGRTGYTWENMYNTDRYDLDLDLDIFLPLDWRLYGNPIADPAAEDGSDYRPQKRAEELLRSNHILHARMPPDLASVRLLWIWFLGWDSVDIGRERQECTIFAPYRTLSCTRILICDQN